MVKWQMEANLMPRAKLVCWGGLHLGGSPTVSEGVCKGKKIVVEVDKGELVFPLKFSIELFS